MSITLDQIAEYEERLRAEIVQRECLLAALGVFRTYSAKGQWPESLDLGSLTSALVRPVHNLRAEPAPLPAPAPVSLPPPPPPKPYIHPELEKLIKHNRTNVGIVRWAIGQMTEDFSLANIRKLLARAGYSLVGPEISVVLTRLKRQGEIEEIERAHGPTPAMFRKPEAAASTDAEATNAAESTEVAAEPAVP
jgi:hypothetical protein